MKEDLLKYKKQLILGPLFKLFEAVLELLIPTLMVTVIDKGVKNADVSYIVKTGILMLGIALLGFGSALICQYFASVASQGFGTRLRNRMFKKVLGFTPAETDKIGIPALVNRITNDVNILQQAVAMLIRLVVRAPFICIGSLIMAMLLNIKLSLIILAALPLLAGCVYLIMKLSVPIYKKVQKKLDRMTVIVRENLSGVRVIRAFAKEKHEKDRFDVENKEYFKYTVKVNKITALLNPLTSVIMNIAIIAILYFGRLQIGRGQMTDGEIIAFVNYITYMVTALLVIANLVVLFTKAAASYSRVSEVLNTEASIKEKVFGGGIENAENIKDYSCSVRFDHVSFSYIPGAPVLKDINFTLKKGETLGIIGGTGSGKTTLVNLILRFYDATDGNVYVFDKNVKDWNINSLRQTIAVAAQRVELFSGTVESNIRSGNDTATDEEIQDALINSQAEEFVSRLPEKEKSKVERGGANFSGGQKQRLSIARALVRKSDILILDDSSGALDYATEARLRSAINKLGYDNLIIVAQRVGSVKNADKILVLEDGICVGQGTHDELEKNCEVYKEILKLS